METKNYIIRLEILSELLRATHRTSQRRRKGEGDEQDGQVEGFAAHLSSPRQAIGYANESEILEG